MNAHLLTIGDEILIGQIIDTNTAWMSQALNQAGIAVNGKSSVGDTREAILNGVAHAASAADVVIMTGGLGPTKDDITKKTLAELFNSEMAFHEATHQRIAGYFEKINRPLPPAMRDQATLPLKATILENKVGTAPGMWFEADGKVYISLPGVPFEMEYLMAQEVIPRLRTRFQVRPIAHRTLLTAGEGESNIAKRIEAFEDALPPHIKLAYLPALGQVRLRLSALGTNDPLPDAQEKLENELDRYRDTLAALIPEWLYGFEDDSLERCIGRLLLAQNKQLGTAESCTGGYIAHLITSVPGASNYFQGAAVTYSNTQKMKALGVRPETLEAHGAVSEATVREMAIGALKALDVDVALAVSGIAGPDGGTAEKPVGTIWIAVADRERCVAYKTIFGRDRMKNIQLSATWSLNTLRKFLLDTL